jgi:acetate kinase
MRMNILTFNCGSSSQGFKVYQIDEHKKIQVIASGKAKNVATKTQSEAFIEWQVNHQSGNTTTALSSHRMAAEKIIALLNEHRISVNAIGHRIVHGGPDFQKTTIVNAATMESLHAGFHYAPVHNANSYHVIEVCLEHFSNTPQYVTFDTAFHATIPEYARQYAIPREIANQYNFRKYGFHGLSYQYVSGKTAELMGKNLQDLTLILCHLGTGGSSVAAMDHGNVLDTSMGYTPLPGLVMSTRCGDIDAEIVLELIRQGLSADEVSDVLNKKSGLIGLSGFSSNLEEIITESEQGNQACQLAFDVYTHRLRCYLGAYFWSLNGADAIIFTDDIGVKSWKLREKVLGNADQLGIQMDLQQNKTASFNQPHLISTDASNTQIWVMPTDEEWVIMQEVMIAMKETPSHEK